MGRRGGGCVARGEAGAVPSMMVVWCVAVCGDLVVSGHMDRCLRVWSTAKGGRCEGVLRGHKDSVGCLSSWKQYLVSGSKRIMIWEMVEDDAPVDWPCAGSITVHSDWVQAMVCWNGRVISGSRDKTICVCNIVTQEHETTLGGASLSDNVLALALGGSTLFSTGAVGVIHAWALGSWEHLRQIRVNELGVDVLSCTCLTVRGGAGGPGGEGAMLLCGGKRRDSNSGFLVVLDAGTMKSELTLLLDGPVDALLSLQGGVWGLVGHRVVLWGKAERTDWWRQLLSPRPE